MRNGIAKKTALFGEDSGKLFVPGATDVPQYTRDEVIALQALYGSEEEPGPGYAVINTLVTKVCLRYETPYVEDDAMATGVLIGRQFVGKAVRWILTLDATKVAIPKSEEFRNKRKKRKRRKIQRRKKSTGAMNGLVRMRVG